MVTNLLGMSPTGLTVSADRFQGLYAVGSGWASAASAASGQSVMPCAGTFQNLYIKMDTGDATFTRTFAIYKNGSDTGVTVTLGTGVTSGSDTTHTASFAAGDTVSIHTTATGTTTSTGTIRWTLGASCAANVSMLLGGTGGAVGVTLPVYSTIQSYNLDTTTAGNVESVMPTAGTIKNAYVVLNSAIAAGKDYSFTLVVNGSDTTLVVTINTAVATGNDTTHSVSVNAGDRYYWKVSTSVVPASKTAFISAEFDPTTDGESVHSFGGATAQTNSAVRYQGIAEDGIAYSATESVRQVISQAAVWKKLYVYEQTILLVGTYQYQLDKNGTAGNPTVTANTSSQTFNDTTNTNTTAVGDTISMAITPALTPTASIVEWGIVSYITPPSTGGNSQMMMGFM